MAHSDTKFLGWVICVCSLLFIASLFAIPVDDIHLASTSTQLSTSK